jgi:eukaryotic-like serine/threonine-protein kinase
MPKFESDYDKKRDIYHLVGSILKGRYQLEEFVDEGGMGVVYQARDSENQSIVAVKILAPRFLTLQGQAETYLKLFKQEAEIAQKLKHSNIVSIYDSGIENGTAFIVMEWLNGCTLGEELIRSGPLSLVRAAFILRQVCAALDAAHHQKIIHLDLKPNNIFLINEGSPNEHVKVIDFGLARIMQSTLGTTISRVVGTPFYMAPEIFTNKASRLSDIYSLGVVTYEILTGLRPFSQSNIYALVNQHIEQPAPSVRTVNPAIPELVDELIQRAMSKHPKERPKSAHEFYEEFALVLRSIENPTLAKKRFQPVVYARSPLIYNVSPPMRPRERTRRQLHTLKVLNNLLLALFIVFCLLGLIFNEFFGVIALMILLIIPFLWVVILFLSI